MPDATSSGKLLPRLYLLPRKRLVTFTSQPEPQLKCGDTCHQRSPGRRFPFDAVPCTVYSLFFHSLSCFSRLLLPLTTTAPACDSDGSIHHVSNTGKGARKAHRVDFIGASEHGGTAERQCCACAGGRWWRTAVHGLDVCAMMTIVGGLLTHTPATRSSPSLPAPRSNRSAPSRRP